MIPNSFPRTQGTLSKEQYLLLIILALLHQTGGELRLTAQNLEAVDAGGSLITDWDTESQQLILRAGSAQMVVAQVRGAGWQSQVSTKTAQPISSTTSDSTAKHRGPLTDDEIREIMQKARAADLMRQWKSEGATAVANMPPPEDAA